MTPATNEPPAPLWCAGVYSCPHPIENRGPLQNQGHQPSQGVQVEANDDIAVPLATLTLTYGLDHNGHPILTEHWQAHDDSDEVPFITRTGMLGMATQTLTIEAIQE